MSFIYSRALVEEYSQANCLETHAFAQSSTNPMPKPSLWRDKTMEPSHHSQFGMTCEPLTESHGAELLMWFLEGSRVKTYQPKGGGMDSMVNVVDSGQKWRGSLAKYDPVSRALKTAQCSLIEDLNECLPILPAWGLMLNGDVYQHPMRAHHTTVTESGLLPTPMASDWKGGTSSIRKDTGKQRLDQFRDWIKSVHGLTYPIPEHSEAVMGWPIGHTDLKPLAMDRFRNVPQLPTKFLEVAE
jgi:hypothetical protein